MSSMKHITSQVWVPELREDGVYLVGEDDRTSIFKMCRPDNGSDLFLAGYISGLQGQGDRGSPPPESAKERTEFPGERHMPRSQRQSLATNWASQAFGHDEVTSLPQRGLRLLEEAIEAFQAVGGDEGMAKRLISFVFARPPGEIGQELGGVAVTLLALAEAAGLSADEEECREIHRVLSKPLREFTQRNASKNAAGFKIGKDGGT